MANDIQFDDVDQKLLRLLQIDSGRPLAEIADLVGISPSPCWRRIQRLKKKGVIESEKVIINPTRLGLDVVAYVFVSIDLSDATHHKHFEEQLPLWPEVISCERISGPKQYLLKVATKDTRAFDQFVTKRLFTSGYVASVDSHIITADVYRAMGYPINVAPEQAPIGEIS